MLSVKKDLSVENSVMPRKNLSPHCIDMAWLLTVPLCPPCQNPQVKLVPRSKTCITSWIGFFNDTNKESSRSRKTMINHFITANALLFYLLEYPLLDRILVLASSTDNSYKPPRSDEMRRALLDANYTAHQTPALLSLYDFGFGI